MYHSLQYITIMSPAVVVLTLWMSYC